MQEYPLEAPSAVVDRKVDFPRSDSVKTKGSQKAVWRHSCPSTNHTSHPNGGVLLLDNERNGPVVIGTSCPDLADSVHPNPTNPSRMTVIEYLEQAID